jgi:hypothetical protein
MIIKNDYTKVDPPEFNLHTLSFIAVYIVVKRIAFSAIVI